jgi:geranylgeranyl reductase family protein
VQADFDVIVVGAGPSGTTAAYCLKRLGYRVLVLDKRSFPRVKPCGGGISIKALNLMPWSVGPIIERAVKTLGMGVKTQATERFEIFEADGYLCTFAVREEFDRFNFEKTIECGVEFEQTFDLTEIDEHTEFVRVRVDGKTLMTRYVIGADGANSAVRHLLGTGGCFYRGFALEGLVDYANIETELITEFFFGYVKNGYGWLFPKGDHVNVGIYTWDGSVKLSKQRLRAYAINRLGSDKLHHIVGFPIEFGGRNYLQNCERVLLVGDAAGFAEPLLGEGIHNALKSGRAAASAISAFDNGQADSLHRAYKKQLEPLFNDLARCEVLKRFFYSNLDGMGFAALNFPISKTALMRGFAAGKTMYELTNTCLLSPLFKPLVPLGLREFLERKCQTVEPFRLTG